jgi:septum formation protein
LESIVLASGSPRRHALLNMIGLRHRVVPSTVVELIPEGANPAQIACELAAQKAREVARAHPNMLTIGADTIVVLDGQILGKPADEYDALRMLNMLKNNTHEVITGVALVHFTPKIPAESASVGNVSSAGAQELPEELPKEVPSSAEESGPAGSQVWREQGFSQRIFHQTTSVTFADLSEQEIRAYIATGSPMDKAGSYGIQDDLGSLFVSRIVGDYYNVVGLPLQMLYEELKSFAPEVLTHVFNAAIVTKSV